MRSTEGGETGTQRTDMKSRPQHVILGFKRCPLVPAVIGEADSVGDRPLVHPHSARKRQRLRREGDCQGIERER